MTDTNNIAILEIPRVFVVARQTMDEKHLGQFLQEEGISWETDTEVASDKLVEVAGRVCYMSFAKPRPGGNKAYLNHILEVGHGSVLEHATWTLLITGVSRSLTHELVRHRAGAAYSQLSQRYVDESKASFVIPDVIANHPELKSLWLEAVTKAQQTYVELVQKLQEKLAPSMLGSSGTDSQDPAEARTALRKACRQAARSVLPNATETKITVTMNARAWRHFLEMRCTRHAENEIRRLAMAVYTVLLGESPRLFGDYKIVPLADGTFELSTEHKKV